MPPVVILARGNTPDIRQQSIDQIKNWIETNDVPGITADTVQSLFEWTEENAATAGIKQDAKSYLYVAAGTDTVRDRQGPDDPAVKALERARDTDGARLIVDTLAGLPVEDVFTVARTGTGTDVYDATHDVTITPPTSGDEYSVATRRAIEVLAGTAEHADALLAGIEWQGGRPPLGCTSEGGRLAPDVNYDTVCRTLQRVEDGDMSKTRAADKLSCARKTIDNALDRPELYRLE
ncbi:hypothetical protein [Halostella salina]|uniref:hypothetical protein n=1 Tax=Halostella salina TaxID=1547897 RepID=UPI000EF7C236|nr:hypothetical protein [Halostella salina]